MEAFMFVKADSSLNVKLIYGMFNVALQRPKVKRFIVWLFEVVLIVIPLRVSSQLKLLFVWDVTKAMSKLFVKIVLFPEVVFVGV